MVTMPSPSSSAGCKNSLLTLRAVSQNEALQMAEVHLERDPRGTSGALEVGRQHVLAVFVGRRLAVGDVEAAHDFGLFTRALRMGEHVDVRVSRCEMRWSKRH